MIRKYIMIASALLCGSIFTACNDDNDTPTFPEKTETTYDMSGFARGADVSWLSEMESSGYKFYTSDGKEQECMSLLRDLGINAIRLRVWVNPENDTEDVKGWCNKGDVLLKAWRAHNLGYRLMIDFHYSDRWADPVQQAKPKAWENYTVEELEQAIADHTKDVLGAIKEMVLMWNGCKWVMKLIRACYSPPDKQRVVTVLKTLRNSLTPATMLLKRFIRMRK